ncbi:uncharacterized protein LOC114242020 [Bombyx mandarina]|uniref:Uncharacterized protein n=2 Tax=Bombyx TaxID=7090 RepID=A0A8R1TFE8_BOMMO|nr:ecdysis triggering hormone preproprotein [Bombyx mori]XP_028028840.1 uncharacterized protein LOC114242020 [Bombyx mandarina]
MTSKLTMMLFTLSLMFIAGLDGSFIKPNNVPRVGRSNEAFDEDVMGYVIKSNKNIPRMGRRNYDSGNHFDIPKVYSLPFEFYGDNEKSLNNDDAEEYYAKKMGSMKK